MIDLVSIFCFSRGGPYKSGPPPVHKRNAIGLVVCSAGSILFRKGLGEKFRH